MPHPPYLKHNVTGRIHVWTEYLTKNKDLLPCYEAPESHSPPLVIVKMTPDEFEQFQKWQSEQVEPTSPAPKPELPKDPGREGAIIEAIKSIPKKSYVAPAFGRPSLPALKDVEEITGFKVLVDEVVAAVKKLPASE